MRRSSLVRRLTTFPCAVLLLATGVASPARAQRQEFTRQTLLITSFDGADRKLARSVADELRGRVQRLHERRELEVVSGGEITDALRQSGFDDEIESAAYVLRPLLRKFRADEYVRGTAERTPQGIRLTAQLVLVRDERLVQPLPVAVGRDVNAAAAQLAQAQAELGQHEDAYASLRRALASGEDSALVAQAALARGNALYRAANGTQRRDDFRLALRYLALADSTRSTPQSQFLLGATALSVTLSAATEAPKTRDCDLSRLASELLPVAREKVAAGAETAPDAARQYLAYLEQLQPVVAQQMTALCKD